MKADGRRSKSDSEGKANSDSSPPPPTTTTTRKKPFNVEQRSSNNLKLPDDFSYLRNVRGKSKEKLGAVDDRVRQRATGTLLWKD